MGNSATKESRNPSAGHSRENSNQSPNSPTFASSFQNSSQPAEDRPERGLYSSRISSRSRHDLSFLGLGSGPSDRDATAAAGEVRKETKQERAARHAERDRVQRARERERSMREEGVDGGYLVTLGVYVGPEDFSKSTVRQLQIERRLAPFWRGLNEHSSSWTEHQLVAAARGKPIPAADEIPSPEERSTSPGGQRQASKTSDNSKTLPISVQTPQAPNESQPSEAGLTVPDQNIEHSSSAPGSQPAPSPLFRGRAKTLTSLTSTKSGPTADLSPQEVTLPKNSFINGQPIEAYLYKDIIDCPICFLSYPPWLNKTRCCDQPICSECFVQIKRPEPHPPEHGEESGNPTPSNPYDDEEQLVSEPSACPFCVQPDFGVMYNAPPFRRGLAYQNQGMEAPSSFSPSNGGPLSQRRRTESISANAAAVITTDKVRPDWAKKLADARAHQARRSAAATALHTAAYRMGAAGPAGGFPVLGRRRRVLVNAETGQRVEGVDIGQLLATLEGQGSSRNQARGNGDLFPGRGSSRGHRPEDLEEMMMMEAIRQSLASEEERNKKSEKDAKKEEKKKAKEQKKADKAARKSGYSASANSSGFFGPSASTSQGGGADSNIDEGKGKARASSNDTQPQAQGSLGWNPMEEPSSTINTSTAPRSNAQKHLEKSRANLDSDLNPNPLIDQGPEASPRHRTSSSSTESFESATESTRQENGAVESFDASPNPSRQQLPFVGGTTDATSNVGNESNINFRSLVGMIGKEERDTGARRLEPSQPVHESRSRGVSNESAQPQPPQYNDPANAAQVPDPDAITTAPQRTESNEYDQKHFGDISMLEKPTQRERSN
ncbi:MAG: SNF1-interacting protein [Chrysothrix sp. TS-e1954]|nr:MAG: SNF1-interacting protein [Chrysothrix sp. TS-e1954]